MSLTFTDMFCGAGGSSLGLTAARLELRLAANHWDRAIETHSANFADAEHLCADVSNYDMRRLPSTDVLWASPICTENSPAGGRRRSRGQLALLEHGPVAQAGFERTRATFHDVIRATEVHRYAAVVVENVVEAADWELFDWWVAGMCQLRPGYRVQYLSVSSAHVGGPGNDPAPQWRDRLYLVFTRAGVPLPDLDPRPPAWCPACGVDVPAVQSWKRPAARRIGKYRAQYLYRCPNSACRHAVVEPYVLPAATAIDWTDLGQRIGDRKRPLAAATMRRIEVGLQRYARPHTVPAGGTWRTAPADLAEPMPTRTARETDALVVPTAVATADSAGCFLAVLRRNGTAAPVAAPLATVAAGGNHHALVVPYYRTGVPKPANRPLDTVTTRERFALAVADAVRAAEPVRVEDCRLRMLQPREHLRSQRIGDSYIVTGNKGEQTMQAGNAVSANVAQWIGERVAVALGGAA